MHSKSIAGSGQRDYPRLDLSREASSLKAILVPHVFAVSISLIPRWFGSR
jgi:hypothetical protein